MQQELSQYKAQVIKYLAVRWLSAVHLVDSDNELLHSQGVGKEGMLTSLSILRDTCLKLSHTSRHNQYSTVSLQGGQRETQLTTCAHEFTKHCIQLAGKVNSRCV